MVCYLFKKLKKKHSYILSNSAPRDNAFVYISKLQALCALVLINCLNGLLCSVYFWINKLYYKIKAGIK